MATVNLGHVVGPGVPSGGSTGQVLKKTSGTNYATAWADVNDLNEISTLHSDLGIVVNGKQSAVSAAIGQYVILKNSTITGKTDGLYTAAKEIPASTDIDNTYLTAVPNGGLNALNSKIEKLNGSYCMTYPIAIEKVVASASSWLSFSFQARKGDKIAWTLRASTSGSGVKFTTSIQGSVHGWYNNGDAYVSSYVDAKEIGPYVVTDDETITISSYVNGAVTFRNVAVTVFRKGS